MNLLAGYSADSKLSFKLSTIKHSKIAIWCFFIYNKTNMAYFFIELGFILLDIFRFTIDTSKLNYVESSLFFKKTMLHPSSRMHHLFFNKNNYWSRPLHIKPLAIELIVLYATSFINIGLGITIWILEAMQIEHFALIVIFWVIFSAFLVSTICIEVWIHKNSWSCWREECALSKKEIDEIEKEIKAIYPHFFEKSHKK